MALAKNWDEAKKMFFYLFSTIQEALLFSVTKSFFFIAVFVESVAILSKQGSTSSKAILPTDSSSDFSTKNERSKI